MKKHIIILGDARSGKSSLVNTLTSQIINKVILPCPRKIMLPDWIIQAVSRAEVSPSMIIIDDIREKKHIEDILNLYANGINLFKRGAGTITITPIFVFVCQEHIRPSEINTIANIENLAMAVSLHPVVTKN